MSEERNNVTKDVGTAEYFSTGKELAPSIDDVLSWLTESKEYGATHIHISASCYDNECDEIYVQPLVVRLETDAEYNFRVEKERVAQSDRDRRALESEKAQYEILKKKFEGQ